MPRLLLDFILLIVGAGIIFFSGWIRERLKLSNWHLAAVLAAGIVIFVIGVQADFFPVIILGVIIFVMPCAAWGWRLLQVLVARRK